MKLQLGNPGSGFGEQKKNMIVAGVLILIIVAALFFAYRTFFPPEPEDSTYVSEMAPEQSPVGGPTSPGGGLAPSSATSPSPALPMAPSVPSPTATGSEAGASPGAPVQPAPMAASTAERSAVAEQSGMNTIKVFNAVTVVYPKEWKIVPTIEEDVAIFSDGNGRFEIRTPDPTATSAEAIALSASHKVAKGGLILQKGRDKVGGFDAYWLAVKHAGQMLRIVGIDAPTRIVLVESVKSGGFDRYRERFNKMQQALKFGG